MDSQGIMLVGKAAEGYLHLQWVKYYTSLGWMTFFIIFFIVLLWVMAKK